MLIKTVVLITYYFNIHIFQLICFIFEDNPDLVIDNIIIIIYLGLMALAKVCPV